MLEFCIGLGWKEYRNMYIIMLFRNKLFYPHCASHSNDPIRLSFAQFLTSCRYIWQIWTDSGQFSFTMCLKICISRFFFLFLFSHIVCVIHFLDKIKTTMYLKNSLLSKITLKFFRSNKLFYLGHRPEYVKGFF